ncbi:molybdopterin molybdotransferase MoeA [Kitasatospora sp. NPDC054939]
MWSVDEHLADVLAGIGPLPVIELQLLDAQGCRLAEDVVADGDLPAFDNSSMDGYAVRTADTAGATDQYPSVLAVVGDIAAGAGELPRVGPGQAARIMTGAPVPPGAEAVAPVEWTDGGTGTGLAADAMTARGTGGRPGTSGAAGAPAASGPSGVPGSSAASDAPGSSGSSGSSGASGAFDEEEVRVLRPVTEGAHIRRRGSDVRAGTKVLDAGTLLGPTQLGLLAAIGRATVKVHPRPRVVVISTGSELVPPGEPVGPGRIPDSNSFTLTAAARDAGAIAYRVGGVPDDPEVLRAVLDEQLGRADLIVTSGGVSVGAYDVVKEALQPSAPQGGAVGSEGAAGEDAGGAASGAPAGAGASAGAGTSAGAAAGAGAGGDYGRVDFRKLRMQPGKPQGFGRVGPGRGVPLLALPGNPVSSYISFELFVRPLIRTMLGATDIHRPTVRATCPAALRSPAGRRQFLRGRYTAEGATVTPVGGEGSHLVGALARANCLIVVDEDTVEVPVGSEVQVVLLTD